VHRNAGTPAVPPAGRFFFSRASECDERVRKPVADRTSVSTTLPDQHKSAVKKSGCDFVIFPLRPRAGMRRSVCGRPGALRPRPGHQADQVISIAQATGQSAVHGGWVSATSHARPTKYQAGPLPPARETADARPKKFNTSRAPRVPGLRPGRRWKSVDQRDCWKMPRAEKKKKTGAKRREPPAYRPANQTPPPDWPSAITMRTPLSRPWCRKARRFAPPPSPPPRSRPTGVSWRSGSKAAPRRTK